MKILANDGISANGVEELETAGFEVSTVTVAQEQLENYINNEGIVAPATAHSLRRKAVLRKPELL